MRFHLRALVGLLVGTLVSCQIPQADPGEGTPPITSGPSLTADPAPLHALPFVTVEAEAGRSSGRWPAPSTVRFTPGAEASGRRYVELEPGEALQLVAPIAADSLVVRVCYPDSASGAGQSGTLIVTIGGSSRELPITSRYSWEYGSPSWGSTDVWNKPPSAGQPRHFWDETNLRVPAFTAGVPIELTNPQAQGQTVLVDLVDFEAIPDAVTPPPGSVNFATFSPAADGTTDDTAKLQQAINAAGGGTLFVPEGTYRVGSVDLGSVTLQGAGLWRTRLVGPASRLRFTGATAHVADLAIFGETNKRNDLSDAGNAFAGNPGTDSTIERVWVEHKKCAFWVGTWNNAVGPSNLTIRDCRFRDLMADAVNLCSGTRDSLIEGCSVRNSGDDALAAWSPESGGPSGGGNTFRNNDVQSPWVASGIALYGGGPFVVEGNTVRDTVTTGSGVYVSSNFGAHPFTGSIVVSNNLVIRGGAHESDPGGTTGALRVLAGDRDMAGATITFTDNTVVDALVSAVSIQGPWNVGSLVFDGLTVSGGGVLADVKANALGSAAFTRVTSTDTAGWNNASSAFALSHP